jgi:hypothetical protein
MIKPPQRRESLLFVRAIEQQTPPTIMLAPNSSGSRAALVELETFNDA